MSKAVLISIRPKWCKKIISGEKTVEIRKTAPRLKTPFKCYIYCTNGTGANTLNIPINVERLLADCSINGMRSMNCQIGNSKVIGEFVCNEIQYADASCFVVKEDGEKALEGSCIDKADLFEYLRWNIGTPRAECAPFYRWQISDLKIYGIPLELDFFRKECVNDINCESCAMYRNVNGTCGNDALKLRRPPQSWCYVIQKGGICHAQD